MAARIPSVGCRWWVRAAAAAALAAVAAGAATGAEVDALRTRWAELQAAEAVTLAPKLSRDAEAGLAALAQSPDDTARQALVGQRLDLVAAAIDRAREVWPDLLPLRAEARAAGAPRFDPRNWRAAENIFHAAAQKLEAGRTDAARKQARECTPLYEAARRNAWRAGLLHESDSLLQRLDTMGARQYVPRSFVRAVDARTAADAMLQAGEPPTPAAQAAGARALAEARHAFYLLDRIRGVCEKNATDRLEDSVLEWEAAAGRASSTLGLTASFEQGLAAPLAAVEQEAARLIRERDGLRSGRATQAGAADSLRFQNAALRDTLRDRELQLASLRVLRQEKETMTRIQHLFAREEGRVLLDDRDVILRLHGLEFASGKAELPPEAVPLLEKISEVVRALPGSRVVVEGHTDAQGKPEANQQLSEERAAAVRDWLQQHSGLDPARISSVGWGAGRPVATNDSEAGRALNRRIEIILARPQ